MVTQLSGKHASARSVRSVLPLPATKRRTPSIQSWPTDGLRFNAARFTLVAAEQQQEGHVAKLLEHVQEQLV